MRPTRAQLDALRALAERATPGPWSARIRPLGGEWVTTAGGSPICYMADREPRFPHKAKMGDDPDAAYIAAASPDVVLGYIAEIGRLRLSEGDGREILARWMPHFERHALFCQDKTLMRDTRSWINATARTEAP